MIDQNLKQSVESFARDLADKAKSFVKDISELEVRTFTTPNDAMARLTESKQIEDPLLKQQMRLRAYTRVSFDCDTIMCVPVDQDDQVDMAVWDLHQTMVNQAMEHRATMLRTLGEALTSALRALTQVDEY